MVLCFCASYFFCNPQFCASCARVCLCFFCSWRNWLFGDSPHASRFLERPQCLLYETVLQRVKSDDGEPSARREERAGCRDEFPECIKLIIDRDAKSLECLGGGVNAAAAVSAWYRVAYDFRKLRRSLNRLR